MSTNSLMLRVREALQTVTLSGDNANIIASGRVKDLSVSPAGVAKVTLNVERLPADGFDALAPAIETALAPIEGVARAVVARPTPTTAPAAAPPASAPSPGGGAAGGHANPLGLSQRRAPSTDGAKGLADVKQVIAVASGKGGVGKSTLAANLAAAIAATGRRVGLLDADVYGPSLPTLLGTGEIHPTLKDGRIQPVEAHGLQTMSMGYLLDDAKALAWRGPMVMGALRQLTNDVDWGALDVLIIDTPPGTGDVHLSLGQMRRAPSNDSQNASEGASEGDDAPALTGAVIVSTPQELALADVRRGVSFFQKIRTPILGIIENMAYLENADGSRQHLFGEGGARRAAEALEVPFLGEVPLLPELRAAADEGRLLPDDETRAVFAALAEQIVGS